MLASLFALPPLCSAIALPIPHVHHFVVLSIHRCTAPRVTHIALTDIALTHIALTHVALTQIALTQIALTHIALTHIALTHITLTHIALTHVATPTSELAEPPAGAPPRKMVTLLLYGDAKAIEIAERMIFEAVDNK